jgi:hypothetical protein
MTSVLRSSLLFGANIGYSTKVPSAWVENQLLGSVIHDQDGNAMTPEHADHAVKFFQRNGLNILAFPLALEAVVGCSLLIEAETAGTHHQEFSDLAHHSGLAVP